MFAYLDCASGISGDMTLGALLDAGAELPAIQSGLDSMGLSHVRLSTNEVKKKGFRALHLQIEHPPEHAHRHLHHITDMIDKSTSISARAKTLACQIFTAIGEAEAKVHGTTIRKVHFHEVGAIDSIADIVGTAIAWDQLGITAAAASPIPTGQGFITIAHGRCSVPAPATAELLTGIPLAASTVDGELTTPTGAAIVKALCSSFGPVPSMSISKIGYGAGTKDFDTHPNLLRILLGQPTAGTAMETVWVLETNLDDISGEVIGYAQERLLAAGALDVFVSPIQMKKNRPAVTLSLLAKSADCDRLEGIIFAETGTLGVRRWATSRRALERQSATVSTAWGEITGKIAVLPDGSRAFSPEFDACREIALRHNLPLRTVLETAQRAFA
jgi:pyridinium-3,5-bisthiocarboxylic acid mononucleotide nickel chelatase